ncbi:Arc family DNA-binding protein [Endozoicomonas lisbonensis]|uniref:Arc-like DNA binding domain-containing protein n=2 Tax=Endozoicomonas lisbonensis TaxID=3120522 RepID=A0ABV2SP48_9GAMM
MSRHWPTLTLRLTQDVIDQMQESATRNRRSINSEYLSRLESSLFDEPELLLEVKELRKLVDEQKDQLQSMSEQLERLTELLVNLS